MGRTQLKQLSTLVVSTTRRVPTRGESVSRADAAIDVAVVESADEAYARLLDGDVHCVVCEHDPPHVDGVAFVETVREEEPTIPLLVIPADGAPDCTQAALAAGATDVLQAPSGSISAAALANRIRRFVEASEVQPFESSTASSGEYQPQAAGQGSGGLDDEGLGAIGDAIAALQGIEQRDGVGNVVTAVLADVLGVPGVGVFCFDDEENHLEPVAITDEMVEYYGGETVFGLNRPDSVTWQVFVTGKAQTFDDVRTAEGNVNEDTDARACIFVPLGEHGTVAVATDTVGGFSESTHRLVELVAAGAGATLDRIASDALARQQERQIGQQAARLREVDRATDVARELHEKIIGARTRTAVERGILDSLGADESVDVAWIGTIDAESNTLTAQEWTDGGDQYVEDLAPSSHGSDEPARRTARTRSVTHVPNVAEHLDGGGWERTMLSRGFHSVLSVPLAYEGVLYGVLTIYADRPNAFQDPFPSVIAQACETAAHAINAIEREFCVLSGGVTELDLQIDDPDDALNVVAETVGTSIECHELESLSDGSAKLDFSVVDASAESVLADIARLSVVDSVTHASGDEHLFTAEVNRETVGSALVTAGGVPVTITADGTTLDVTVSVPTTVDPRTFLDRLGRRYQDVTMLTRRRRDPVTLTRTGFVHELESVLTDRQMAVLQTAYDNGFFESPREVTGQEVGELLGVSQPTVSHHLRESQGKLFSLLFGDE